MKKILSLALVAVMLMTSLVFTVNAKDPLGTVVEIPYAAEAPSMEDAMPDASWGEKLVHIDKNSPNADITQYKPKGTVKQNLSFDMYGRWTDTTFYLCFVSPDPDFRGGLRFWWGDGIQMVIFPGVVDITYCNGTSDTGWTCKDDFEPWDWAVTFDVDDETPIASDVADGKCTVYGDEKTGNVIVKFAMPKEDLGYKKTEKFSEGSLFSFSLIRIDGSEEDIGEAYVGWLEWGNFYDGSKGWANPESGLYLAQAESTKTKTANTFKFVGGAAATDTPATTDTPAEENAVKAAAAITGTPSSWAKTEVEAALAAGLIPEELTDGFTNGISRSNLSKILSLLLDKVYGKDAEKSDAAFTDTTDAAVLKAANLGIINGYEQADGTFMFKPENTLKRSEMAAIINRVAKLCGQTVTGFDSEVTFTDTASHWCKGELGWPVHNGIVKGTSDTTFSPENTLTVEQTIMMIYRTYTALK